MATSVIQGIMFTSVCRGFISGQGHSADADLPEARGTTEVQDARSSFLAYVNSTGHDKGRGGITSFGQVFALGGAS